MARATVTSSRTTPTSSIGCMNAPLLRNFRHPNVDRLGCSNVSGLISADTSAAGPMKFADSRLITPTSSKLFYGFRLISFQLRRLYPIIEELSKQDRTLGEPWYLRTESEDDLSDVPVF